LRTSVGDVVLGALHQGFLLGGAKVRGVGGVASEELVKQGRRVIHKGLRGCRGSRWRGTGGLHVFHTAF
jgi:hypothetical protein